jgi:hypothetical protein
MTKTNNKDIIFYLCHCAHKDQLFVRSTKILKSEFQHVCG